MTDDSNCHCRTCTTMNEPLSLEGDIRYLKAHIESKDRQLADANLRIEIYREAWLDARASNKPSLGGNLGLQQENERLKVELEASRGQIRNQLQIILDLRKEKETLLNDRTSLMEETDGLYDKLVRIAAIVDGIVD
jgi:hypothetical protein